MGEVADAGSQPQVEICRNTFIDAENAEYLAATTTDEMYMGTNEESGEAEFKPVPESIKKSGVIPEGYAVDYKLDPLFVVAFLTKKGVRYESELDPGMIAAMKETIMAPENLCIVPLDTWEEKQKLAASFIAKVLKEPGEITSVASLASAFFEGTDDRGQH